MREFSVSVAGITDQEYYQACRVNNGRIYGILAVAMVVICGIIILATGNASAAAFLGPLVLYVIFVVVVELFCRFGYKGQLAHVDPVVYRFSPEGWSVTANRQTNTFEWKATVKLKKTKDCLFVFNEGASGNLLPKRLMTADEMRQIETWFKDSRKASKDYEKEQTQKDREKFREEHQDLKFGNRGPSWGPWKKK